MYARGRIWEKHPSIIAGISEKGQGQEEFLGSLGLQEKSLVRLDQIHGSDIVEVTDAGYAGSADGVITSVPGLVLSIRVADCYPVFLYDPVANICGVVHMGRRGSVLGIGRKMVQHTQSDPKNMLVYVGPGICKQCFAFGMEAPDVFGVSYVMPVQGGKYTVDLQRYIIDQLVDAGIQKEHIEVDGRCTYEDATLESYRRDKESAGRMLGVIALVPTI